MIVRTKRNEVHPQKLNRYQFKTTFERFKGTLRKMICEKII